MTTTVTAFLALVALTTVNGLLGAGLLFGIAFWKTGGSPRLMIVSAIALPVALWLWFTQSAVDELSGALTLLGVMVGISISTLCLRMVLPGWLAAATTELGDPVRSCSATVVSFSEAPEQDYVHVTDGDEELGIGWVTPGTSESLMASWDRALTVMGWVRVGAWSGEPGQSPTCAVIPRAD